MFTQKCFIKKYTKELVEKLINIGYIYVFSTKTDYGNCCKSLYTTKKYAYRVDSISDNYYDKVKCIDCGTNGELFLAIAAIRDDSDVDNNQWFIHQDGSFCKCECDSKIDMWGDFEEPEFYPRKATVEELIKYFTNESN